MHFGAYLVLHILYILIAYLCIWYFCMFEFKLIMHIYCIFLICVLVSISCIFSTAYCCIFCAYFCIFKSAYNGIFTLLHILRASSPLATWTVGIGSTQLSTHSPNKCCYVHCWCFSRPAWHYIHCFNGRYFLHKDQPVYVWWFSYMWTHVVGPQLNPVLSTLNVNTAADVDELFDCM